MSQTINNTELAGTISEIVEAKVRQNIEAIVRCMAESDTPDKYSFAIRVALDKSDAHLGVVVKLRHAKKFVDEDERLLELVDPKQPELVDKETYRPSPAVKRAFAKLDSTKGGAE